MTRLIKQIEYNEHEIEIYEMGIELKLFVDGEEHDIPKTLANSLTRTIAWTKSLIDESQDV